MNIVRFTVTVSENNVIKSLNRKQGKLCNFLKINNVVADRLIIRLYLIYFNVYFGILVGFQDKEKDISFILKT